MRYIISALLLLQSSGNAQDFFSLRVGEKPPPFFGVPKESVSALKSPPFFNLRSEGEVFLPAERKEGMEDVILQVSTKLSEFYKKIIRQIERRLKRQSLAFQKRSKELKEAIESVNKQINERMQELSKKTEALSTEQREYREHIFERLKVMEDRNAKRMRLLGIASSSLIVLMSAVAIILLLRRKGVPAQIAPTRKVRKGETKEFEDVHRLHEQGYSIEEIARRTRLSKGEIELILGLRRR